MPVSCFRSDTYTGNATDAGVEGTFNFIPKAIYVWVYTKSAYISFRYSPDLPYMAEIELDPAHTQPLPVFLRASGFKIRNKAAGQTAGYQIMAMR